MSTITLEELKANQEDRNQQCLAVGHIQRILKRLQEECKKDSLSDTVLSVSMVAIREEDVLFGTGQQLLAEFRIGVEIDVTRMSKVEKKQTEDYIQEMLKRSVCIVAVDVTDSFKVRYLKPMEGFSEAVQATGEKTVAYVNVDAAGMNIGINKAVNNIYDFLLQGKYPT